MLLTCCLLVVFHYDTQSDLIRGLVEVSAPVADDNISEEAKQAVLNYGSPAASPSMSTGGAGPGHTGSKHYDL